MFYNDIFKNFQKRDNDLGNLIQLAEKKIKGFPEGRVNIKKQGNKSYCYLVNADTDRSGRLLTGYEHALACDLAQKSYLQKVVRAAGDERRAIRQFLDRYPEIPIEKIYETLPDARKDYIKPIVPTDEEFVRNWLETPFTPKEFEEDFPVYTTIKGERVRSKSEQLIADRLYVAGIPYKYECPLTIGKHKIHPDFSILRVSRRDEVYLEHSGRMDDPNYGRRLTRRSQIYTEGGILQGERLFYTFESSEIPFEARSVDPLIEKVFR